MAASVALVKTALIVALAAVSFAAYAALLASSGTVAKTPAGQPYVEQVAAVYVGYDFCSCFSSCLS